MCMHIAATSPVCVSRDGVPADLVEKEKDIAKAQAEGKPPQAIEKIIQGKLEKYFSNACFLEQPFVKDPDQTIKQLLHAASQEVGSELSVESFIRFQVGRRFLKSYKDRFSGRPSRLIFIGSLGGKPPSICCHSKPK